MSLLIRANFIIFIDNLHARILKFEEQSIEKMEGITILKNEFNDHRLMQIDLNLLSKNEESLEDVFDLIAIEVRKNEESLSWEDAKQQLNKE